MLFGELVNISRYGISNGYTTGIAENGAVVNDKLCNVFSMIASLTSQKRYIVEK